MPSLVPISLSKLLTIQIIHADKFIGSGAARSYEVTRGPARSSRPILRYGPSGLLRTTGCFKSAIPSSDGGGADRGGRFAPFKTLKTSARSRVQGSKVQGQIRTGRLKGFAKGQGREIREGSVETPLPDFASGRLLIFFAHRFFAHGFHLLFLRGLHLRTHGCARFGDAELIGCLVIHLAGSL